MKTTNILVLSLFAIGFSSCQVKVGDVAPNPVVSIDGIWATKCMANSSDSYVKSVQVASGTMTIATLNYKGDRNCNPANLDATILESGPLTNSGDSTAVTEGKNYEWQLSMLALEPNSAATVTAFNNANNCGSNSWALGQPGLLFGCTVSGAFDLSLLAQNATHYGVYFIDRAATPNILQFETPCAISGYEMFCPTPADRPSTVSGDTYFRQ